MLFHIVVVDVIHLLFVVLLFHVVSRCFLLLVARVVLTGFLSNQVVTSCANDIGCCDRFVSVFHFCRKMFQIVVCFCW